MATINKTRIATRLKQEQTTNYEGALAYTLPVKDRLISRVLGSFWNESTFYASGKSISEDIIKEIQEVAAIDPKFILQLAAYARNVIYLRTTPQVLLVEAAQIEACKPFIREYTPKIVKRADEIPAVLAYHFDRFGTSDSKKIPNSLKKGLAVAFTQFDEYQLNKYDTNKKAVSLGDALLLVDRKKDYPVSQAMANYLINDIVDAEALPRIAKTKAILANKEVTPEVREAIKDSTLTWEMFISKFRATKENWELIIPKMGYMALLRNLRNFIEKGVDLAPVLAILEDEAAVKRSKQLPYRFFSAYREVTDQKAQRAIANAFEYSISNVTLDGVTAVATDLSGSMTSAVSRNSKVTMQEVGAVLSAIAIKKSAESVAIGFGDVAKQIHVNPDDRMMTNVTKITNTNVGHSTNAYEIFSALDNKKVDRIILFSDMQCWSSNPWLNFQGPTLKRAWAKYTKEVNPNARLYSFNLAPYGTSQFPSTVGNVTQLNGWSDKVIDYINLLEKKNVMEQEISKW